MAVQTWEDKAVVTNQPAVPQGGSSPDGGRESCGQREYSFTVSFVPIKSPLSLTYWLIHLHITARTTCLPMTQGLKVG